MSVIHWHTELLDFDRALEDGWLVHIVPGAVKVVGAEEVLTQVETLPEILCILVEVVNPDRFTWPALANPRLLGLVVTDENVGDTLLCLLRILQLDSLLVHEVVLRCLDVRVVDHDESPVSLLDLRVHLVDLVDWECLLVEDEVLEVLRVVEIRPKDVHWEAILGEILVALHHQVSAVVLVLAVVEAETVKRRQWSVACQLGESVLVRLWALSGTENEELELVTERDERSKHGWLVRLLVCDLIEGHISLRGVHPSD
jgi:hypothetical protein